MASEEHKELLSALHEVVEASNRTNHAVRAIVLPATILLITVIVAIPLLLLSLAAGAVVIVLAGLVLLGGSVLAVVAQLKETKASEIPGAEALIAAPRPMKSIPELLSEQPPAKAEQARTSSGACRFCGKPFAKGVYDSCADCGKN